LGDVLRRNEAALFVLEVADVVQARRKGWGDSVIFDGRR